ncbi:MAG: pyridoxal phosphate-dependent decarboxylase family protein [Flavobacteriales bacterium]
MKPLSLSPLSDRLRDAYDPDRFERVSHEAVADLGNHLRQTQSRLASSSYPAPSPEEERAHWRTRMEQPSNVGDLHREVVARSNHLHDPRYLGHQVAAILPETAATGMVTDLLNNGQAIYEMGPSNAVHEEMLMNELGQVLGLPDSCGGILCHGGTLGNLVALMAAQRHLALELEVDSWKDGIRAFDRPLVVLVSERAHYCIDRAMRVLGWGAAGTVLVASDDRHRMDVSALKLALEECDKNGKQVMAIVGSAGTTSSGAFDPLEEVAEVCSANGIWFHVDGAHGAAAAFSATHESQLNGLGNADSVVMDFHKVCGLPALCTGVFYKDVAKSYLPFSQQAEYLWESASDLDWWDTGKRTLECTKRMLSTKIAAVRAEYGWDIFGELVDRLWELGRVLASHVECRSDWELAMSPEANIVCFRPASRNGIAEADWNGVVRALRKAHLSSGSSYVVQTEFDGKVWLRCTVMNPLTEEADFVQMLDEFENLLPSVLQGEA